MKIKILFIICSIFLLAVAGFSNSPAEASLQTTGGHGQLAQATPTTSSSGISLPTNTGLPNSDVKTILTKVMNWLLGIVGIIGVISFVVSGILYFTAAGDDSRMKTAKQAMYYSIIGVIVALSGFVIITAVNTMLSGSGSTF